MTDTPPEYGNWEQRADGKWYPPAGQAERGEPQSASGESAGGRTDIGDSTNAPLWPSSSGPKVPLTERRSFWAYSAAVLLLLAAGGVYWSETSRVEKLNAEAEFDFNVDQNRAVFREIISGEPSEPSDDEFDPESPNLLLPGLLFAAAGVAVIVGAIWSNSERAESTVSASNRAAGGSVGPPGI
jgi:hypothetical protein